MSVFVYGVVSLATIGVVTSAAFGADWGEPATGCTARPRARLLRDLPHRPRHRHRPDPAPGRGHRLDRRLRAWLCSGGDFFFISSAPSTMKHLALLTPNGWAIRGFTDLATIGGGFGTIVEPVEAILIFSAVVGAHRAEPGPPGGELMRALAIARASGRRVLRDRVSLFFLIVLPIVVIVIVGAVAQGFNTFRVGVLDLDGTQASRQLVAELSHASGLAVVAYPSLGSLDKAVGRSEINAGVVIPRGLGADEYSPAEPSPSPSSPSRPTAPSRRPRRGSPRSSRTSGASWRQRSSPPTTGATSPRTSAGRALSRRVPHRSGSPRKWSPPTRGPSRRATSTARRPSSCSSSS